MSSPTRSRRPPFRSSSSSRPTYGGSARQTGTRPADPAEGWPLTAAFLGGWGVVPCLQTSKGYVDWVCKYTRPSTDPADTCYQPYDEVEQYEYFYMFNLTNVRRARALVNGGAPLTAPATCSAWLAWAATSRTRSKLARRRAMSSWAATRTAGPAKSSTSSSSTRATACATWRRRACPRHPTAVLGGGARGSAQPWRYACQEDCGAARSSDWVYTAGKSCVTCLDTDNITNINPYYLTAVTTAGGEANYLRYLGTLGWAARTAQNHWPAADTPAPGLAACAKPLTGGPAVNNLLTKLNTSYLARTSLSEEVRAPPRRRSV